MTSLQILPYNVHLTIEYAAGAVPLCHATHWELPCVGLGETAHEAILGLQNARCTYAMNDVQFPAGPDVAYIYDWRPKHLQK